MDKTVLAEKILGCKSQPVDEENTKLKIYFEAKSVNAQTQCQRDKLKSLMDDWKKVLAAHFTVDPDQIDFKREFHRQFVSLRNT
ncbi:unnamed protein product [Echinostoma caproni]|uniref:Nesprin-1 n=1 Tax=Echinostoma caproni TaxID=27848 RepID=A0A183APE3_9TREM|nr:unnamed protein product [Echinostoma caproni]